jgi:hypothetical protein
MTEQTKYCVDCKYISINQDNKELSKCGHPRLVSPVTGLPNLLCATERSGDHGKVYPCGRDGKLYELKP